MSTYNRPPWPEGKYPKFSRVAESLGYKKRGTRWDLLDMLLDYAELHPQLFRKR